MENNIEDMEKKMPFEVPEDYFEGFEEKMMAKLEAIEAEEKTANEPQFDKVRALNADSGKNLKWRRWVTGVAAAAILLIGVFAVVRLQNEVGETGEEIVVAASSTDDAYYDEINDELETEEIEEALAQIEFEEQY